MATTGGTPAIAALTAAGVEFAVHTYEVADGHETYGEAVASAVGVEPARLLKTLLAEVDGAPMVGIVPVDRRLSMKALARAAGGKRAQMLDPAAAERLTGYVTGGISPFGQRRRLPVYLDRSAGGHDTVFVSGGKRGIQLEVAPAVLQTLLGARPAELTG